MLSVSYNPIREACNARVDAGFAWLGAAAAEADDAV